MEDLNLAKNLLRIFWFYHQSQIWILHGLFCKVCLFPVHDSYSQPSIERKNKSIWYGGALKIKGFGRFHSWCYQTLHKSFPLGKLSRSKPRMPGETVWEKGTFQRGCISIIFFTDGISNRCLTVSGARFPSRHFFSTCVVLNSVMY